MKKALLIIFFAVAFIISTSAENLIGFLGISFGTNHQTAKELMINRGFKPPKLETDLLQLYEDESFAGREGNITLGFFKDYFFSGMFMMKLERGKVLSSYRSLKSDLISKYGQPKIDREEYRTPYVIGDGYEETALFSNKANINSTWLFENSNYISMHLSYDSKKGEYFLNLGYQEKETTTKYLAQLQDKKLGDL